MAPRTQTDAGSKKISTHPPVAEMVQSAITNLKNRKGSSLAAIKKYIESNYEGIDLVKIAPFIRRFLKKAVEDGALVVPKGHLGSYKLGPELKNALKPRTEGHPKKAAVRNLANRKSVPKKSASKKGQRAALKKTPAPRKRVKKSKTPKRPSAQKALFQTPQPGKPAAKGKKRTLMDGIVGL